MIIERSLYGVNINDDDGDVWNRNDNNDIGCNCYYRYYWIFK